MSRYVVVDLETTGHSPSKGDEIIDIGLVVIENREIVDEFSTKVKPNQEIPSFITNLTGITQEDVANSPKFEEMAPKLLSYLEDCYFVAHQVQFDFEFLNNSIKKLGYDELELPIIDTVELARMLFPTADSFKLEDITEHLNIEHYSPHRALSDAYVTALLFLEIINKLEQLPYTTLTQLKPLTLPFKGDAEQIIEEILQNKQYQHENTKQTIIQNGLAVKKLTFLTQPYSNEFNTIGDFDKFLNDINRGNILTLRDSQVEMAKHINQTFIEKDNIVIEAGTGLGKTLGYLLPALFHANYYQTKTVISTSTIQLQHQIINRDWPLIYTSLKSDQSVAILKSPSHYIHLLKLKHYLEHYEGYNYDSALSLAMILVWLTETETGDRDEIQLPSKGEDIWPYISGELNEDSDQRASYFQIAIKRAEQASIVIVNHAFLITEHLYKTKRIPSYNNLIIDEAHRFNEVVRGQLGKQIDYVSIAHLLSNLEMVMNTSLIEATKHAADQFFRSIYQAVLFLHSEKDALSDTGKIQLSLDHYHLNAIKSGNIQSQLNDLILSIEQLLNELDKNSFLNQWQRLAKQKISSELHEIVTTIKEFFNQQNNEVRWIDIDQDGAKNAVQLNLEPIQVNNIIYNQILNRNLPTVFTSATIRTNHSFESFIEEMGLDKGTTCIYLPSSFHYEQQVKIYVPSDFPDIKATDPYEYATNVAEYIIALYQELNNKAIVLFTSFEMLKTVHQLIRKFDENQEWTILSQGIQTGSREKLKKMFEKSSKAILLGTSSFWEGIDIQDQSTKIIIMVRLPFDTPNQPMFYAKSKQLEDKNKNAFYHWMLPQAILRFRQAFGRLIRSEHDRAVLFILDQRIMNKNYGKQFLKSIPEVSVLHDRRHRLLNDAKNWMSY